MTKYWFSELGNEGKKANCLCKVENDLRNYAIHDCFLGKSGANGSGKAFTNSDSVKIMQRKLMGGGGVWG